MFAKMGASIDDPAVRQFDGVADIIVRTGSSDEIIVIGAHYDFVDRGCGAIDNWSGIVTLAHLYRSIRMLSAHKTVLFVAFGKEEEGLLGSKAMAAAIPPDQLSNYCAMINVDSVGLAKLFALENASSSSLVELAKKTAARMNIPFYTTRVKGDSDSSSFAAPCHHIVRAVERLDVDFTYPQRSGFQSGSGGRLFRFQIGSRHVAGPRWTTVHRVPQCWEEAVASAVEAPSLIVGDRKRGAAT